MDGKIEELLAIARRIADARERDDWNDLDDAVDDMIEAATVGHPDSAETVETSHE